MQVPVFTISADGVPLTVTGGMFTGDADARVTYQLDFDAVWPTPDSGVDWPSATITLGTPQGSREFLPTFDIQSTVQRSGRMRIRANDQTLVLAEQHLQSNLYLPAGSDVLAEVGSIVSAAGFNWIPPYGLTATLSSVFSMEFGTNWLRTLNALLASVNLPPLLATYHGITVSPGFNGSAAVTVLEDLSAEVDFVHDWSHTPNRVTLITRGDGSNPGLTSTAELLDGSLFSQQRRGRIIDHTEIVRAETQAELDAIVQSTLARFVRPAADVRFRVPQWVGSCYDQVSFMGLTGYVRSFETDLLTGVTNMSVTLSEDVPLW